MKWLPNPPDGTRICAGFDGSDVNDWTAIRCETTEGFQFTLRYGPDERPSIWNPAEWGGEIPRGEVDAAVDEMFERYDVRDFYCDPKDWQTDIGAWSLRHGEEHVTVWTTHRIQQMYDEIRRFEADLREGRITHDGCPITSTHMANARKVAKPGQKYILGKPEDHQKIDVAMASILAHTASMDAIADGWTTEKKTYGIYYG